MYTDNYFYANNSYKIISFFKLIYFSLSAHAEYK